MSYDIFVQDIPRDAKSLEDVPADFEPAPLGKRSHIIEKIQRAIPEADFSDPAWGRIEGDDWSIEINMRKEEDCTGFTFHVRGTELALGVVEAILNSLHLRGIDPQARDFFVAGARATASFHRWRAYRDQVANSRTANS
jgi:hypothetical protein